MKTLFKSQDLWELVDKGYNEEGVVADALKDLKKKDGKVLFFLQQAIEDVVFSLQISAATKAKEAWDALRNGYEENSTENAFKAKLKFTKETNVGMSKVQATTTVEVRLIEVEGVAEDTDEVVDQATTNNIPK
ncbi:hypothetical protein Salat_1746000 [Sesamum alatum]|uniref:DUF4219 domain-containing protein n=1 Tax=Sesamum alatum TaxID=300844 RepID=A0AAE1Y8L2_9LAMI|nr:hypothetical protein Salat_1746000 [Sesamum alatum]